MKPFTADTQSNRESGAWARRHALNARDRKRAEAHALGIDAEYISQMVDRFYAQIKEHPVLGPIFAERIVDWPTHLGRMKAFWRSVLHNSGEYAGSPMVKHLAIPGLDRTHFATWLDLFEETLDEIGSDAATARVHERARMIATSLLNAIVIDRDGLAAARNLEGF